MTDQLEYEPNTDADPIVTSETYLGSSEVPIESGPEQSLAAVANAVPAVGGPIVVDPYAVLGQAAPAPAAVRPAAEVRVEPAQTYVAPTQPYQAQVPQPYATQPYATTHTAYPNPGYPVAPGYGYPAQPQHAPMDAFAIAALACAVAGLLLWAPVIGSILGIIFGIVSLNSIKKTNHRGHGLAVAGIVIGIAGLLFGIMAVVGLISWATYWA